MDSINDDGIVLNDIKFIWNKEKHEINKKKHKVNFISAAYVFFDDFAIRRVNEKHSQKEERNEIIGLANKMFFVVYTEPGNETRIISARKAERAEIKTYVEHRKRKTGESQTPPNKAEGKKKNRN